MTDHSDSVGSGVGGAAHHAATPGWRAQAGPRAGAVVGERYRLSRLVTTDEQGYQYWKARDTVLPRDMAVTIIPDVDASSEIVTATLQCGRLGHGGLPQTLDAGDMAEGAYLAGQWVDGVSVQTLLADGQVEPAIARRITSHIAEAMAAVHAADLALGAIHPALIRVNVDGQIRLSHVVARTGATPQDDIRAIGGLLYLLLTNTWPLAPEANPTGAAAAGHHGTAITPASAVNQLVPQALSELAQQALTADAHTRAGRRMTMSAIAASTRSTNPALEAEDALEAPPAARKPPATPPPGYRAGRSRRRQRSWSEPLTASIVRERRAKLSIAGAMLVILAVLMVIMGSSITKQFLAAIVAPINASDHQVLSTTNPPTTTRTVGTPTPLPGGTSPGSDSDTDSEQVTPQPVPIANATVYDPQGEPPKDYVSLVDQAFDGDPATFWPTWVYKQQFGPGGLKDGVGLVLSFDHPVSPASVTVATTTPGTDVAILTATSSSPTLSELTTLGTATLGEDPVSITLTDAPSSQYLLVWLTTLAPHDGSTQWSGGGFQSTISAITVTGLPGNGAG